MTKDMLHLTQLLNQQYLCESMTVTEIQTLLEFTELVVLEKGDIIAKRGEVGDALYFVISGAAALTHLQGDHEVEVGRMKEGELMGEMSFFDREPRLLQLSATENETQLLRLTRAMYKRLRVEYPYIAVNLLEHAIVSLDHLIRRVSHEEAALARFFFGPGRK